MVDERTLEMTLRNDVKFHDGVPFTADDAVYTLNWQIDPKSKYRFASNMSWLERAEKIDDHRLRVIAKYPNPLMLMRLAVGAPILPAKLHASFTEAGEFGRRKPVGTGPYRVVSIDSANGAVLELNRDYRHGSDCKPAGSIGRMHATPMPDMQTQVAQLMTGGVDLLHVAERDQVELLQRDPRVAVTATQAITFHYLTMDAAGRSGNKALQDVRVRRAIVQALDRELITRSVVPGGNEAKAWDMFCFPIQKGCAGSVKPYPHDLDAARKLLAEAGYANGFDVEISATPDRMTSLRPSPAGCGGLAYAPPSRASPSAPTGRTRLPASCRCWWVNGRRAGFRMSRLPLISTSRAAARLLRDEELTKLEKEGLATVDEAKRREIYGRMFRQGQPPRLRAAVLNEAGRVRAYQGPRDRQGLAEHIRRGPVRHALEIERIPPLSPTVAPIVSMVLRPARAPPASAPNPKR